MHTEKQYKEIPLRKFPQPEGKSVQQFRLKDNRGSSMVQRTLIDNTSVLSVQQKKMKDSGRNNIEKKITQFWTRKGVDSVLKNQKSQSAQKEIGINIINSLDTQGYTVLNVENAYKYRVYCDSFEIKCITRKGWHNREERIIAINNMLDDKEASSTLAHEITHAHQRKRNEEERPYLPFKDMFTREVNAHIQQEIYNIRMGIKPKSPAFRTRGKHININAIKDYVKKLYLGDNREFIDSSTEPTVLERIKPWEYPVYEKKLRDIEDAGIDEYNTDAYRSIKNVLGYIE